ncbi:hypothetical protein P5P86_15130 [Nocardioides sp. BP30]|uniref:hypothetical protein n=1 Tax=Nocardioides sp. BP30 TaxID=3036374 RepID=UPI00246844A3|nr:hypothetical protein [Nocardioides sp. BP30]WGL51287.1 hypothetical protein P5P86_15130 [Nocardioides sp. BP30]
MRLIRHIALAAAAVALTGCGLNSTSADSPTSDTPGPSGTSDTSGTGSADGAGGTATSPAPPASTPAAEQSTPSRTATPTPNGTATSRAATSPPVVTYTDKTGLLQLPVSNASIPDAPAGLRDFARLQLRQMWHDQFQNDPGCEGIGQVRLKRASIAAAYVQVSWGATTPTCPQYAGNPSGWQVWSDDAGHWSVALDGEGTAACADLVAHAIPRSIYPTCSDGSKKVANPVT